MVAGSAICASITDRDRRVLQFAGNGFPHSACDLQHFEHKVTPLSEGPNTEAVRELFREVVDSFEKLEIVVHVIRAGSAVAAPADIAKALGIPLDEVETAVRQLRSEGVFDPSGPWAPAVSQLLEMYDADRIQVLNLLTKTALERVRKQAARVFADAFVLRPGKKKGDDDG